MGKIDIHKATDNEMANSQIDYYIKAGIFKKPGDVNKNTMDITTDRYDALSDTEQKKWFKKVGNEWWNSIAKEEINGMYSDALIDTNMQGDVLEFWNEHLKQNMTKFGKLIGIDKYVKSIKSNKGRITELDTDSLFSIIAERNLDLTKEELDDIKKALKKRRMKGGCGMWRNVGIPYMYKHHRDQLHDFEKDWYEKKLGIDKKDV